MPAAGKKGAGDSKDQRSAKPKLGHTKAVHNFVQTAKGEAKKKAMGQQMARKKK